MTQPTPPNADRLAASARPWPAELAAMLRTTLRARCPRCGEGRLFAGFTQVADVCPVCEVRFDRDDASVLAGMVLVYALAFVSTLMLAVWLIGSQLMPDRELWVLVPYVIGITFLLFRPVKAWWLWLMHRTGEMQTDAEWRAGRKAPVDQPPPPTS